MRLIRLRSVVRHFATGEALCTVGEANERQRNEWQSRCGVASSKPWPGRTTKTLALSVWT